MAGVNLDVNACGCPRADHRLNAGEIASAVFLAAPRATDSQATIAVAIALAESSGDPSACGVAGGHHYTGLWQEQDGAVTLCDPSAAAVRMWAHSAQGTDWGPWSTFTSGAYRPFMPAASVGVRQGRSAVDTFDKIKDDPGSLIDGTTQGILAGATDFLSIVKTLALFITDPTTWLRLGEGLGGAVLIGIALYFIGSRLVRG